MIVINKTTDAERKFVFYKHMLTEDGLSSVIVFMQWMMRHDRDCASWLWVAGDGSRYIEHIAH